MELIGVALLALVALIFYRSVERHHKIAFFRVARAVTVLALLAGGALWLGVQFEEHSEETRRTSVTARFDSASPGAFHFTICNHHSAAVNRARLAVSGYWAGRSTAYPMEPTERSYETATNYVSDFVIAPSACAALSSLRMNGIAFDSVAVTVAGLEFADGSSVAGVGEGLSLYLTSPSFRPR